MKHTLSLGLALVTFIALSAPDVAEARDLNGWIFSGGGGATTMTTGTKFNMYNTDQKFFLVLKDRAGANLAWDSKAPENVELKAKSGSDIKCGDLFAIKVNTEWIIYGKQNFSINITSRVKLEQDSAGDRYQWKFTNCTAGAAIPLNQPVTLTNTVEKDSLVGCKRPASVGVNLCWADDVQTVAGLNVRKRI